MRRRNRGEIVTSRESLQIRLRRAEQLLIAHPALHADFGEDGVEAVAEDVCAIVPREERTLALDRLAEEACFLADGPRAGALAVCAVADEDGRVDTRVGVVSDARSHGRGLRRSRYIGGGADEVDSGVLEIGVVEQSWSRSRETHLRSRGDCEWCGGIDAVVREGFWRRDEDALLGVCCILASGELLLVSVGDTLGRVRTSVAVGFARPTEGVRGRTSQ